MKKKVGKLLLALTILVTLAAGYYAWQHWQLVHDGATTTAQSLTVDRQLSVGKNVTGGLLYRYFAAYTFADRRGKVYSGRQTIDGSRYQELAGRAEGVPVTIYYSRSNPAVNALDRNTSRNVAIVLGLIALLGWGAVLSRKL